MKASQDSEDEIMFVIEVISEDVVVINQGIIHGIRPGQRILFYGIDPFESVEFEIDNHAIQIEKGEGIVSKVYNEKSEVKIDSKCSRKIPEPNWANIPPLNRTEFYRDIPFSIEKGDLARIK